jgi:hypothetical protein
MATSGSYTFSVQMTDIVREAMLNIGKLGESEQPSAQEYTDCGRKLNMLVKQWQGKTDFAPGLKMWTRRIGALLLSVAHPLPYQVGPTTSDNWTLVSGLLDTATTASSLSGTSTVTLSSITALNGTTVANGWFIAVQIASTGDLFSTTVNGAPAGLVVTLNATLPGNVSAGAQVFAYQTKASQPIVIDAAYLRDSASNDVPMDFMTVQDYARLPSKMQPQFVTDPYKLYFEFQLGNANIFLDCYGAADTTKFIVMNYREAVQDFVNTTDNPELPQEWYRPLCWGLTKEIAPMFNKQFSADMATNLAESLAFAQQKDADTTTLYFQPGNEGG